MDSMEKAKFVGQYETGSICVSVRNEAACMRPGVLNCSLPNSSKVRASVWMGTSGRPSAGAFTHHSPKIAGESTSATYTRKPVRRDTNIETATAPLGSVARCSHGSAPPAQTDSGPGGKASQSHMHRPNPKMSLMSRGFQARNAGEE